MEEIPIEIQSSNKLNLLNFKLNFDLRSAS